MSRNANELRLVDLPEVKPHLISKLRGARVESIYDLAISIPHAEQLEGRIVSLENKLNDFGANVNKRMKNQLQIHSNNGLATGWLLDITIEENCAVVWIRTLGGHTLELVDSYQPTFYILPKREEAGLELLQILSQLNIEFRWEKKFTDIFEDDYRRENLMCVYPDSLQTLRRLVMIFENDPRVAQIFNSDLVSCSATFVYHIKN
jgi:hypothetical protein